MIDVSSRTRFPASGISVSLTTVYYVRADSSYDVDRPRADEGMLEAFRTISGSGTLTFHDHPSVVVGGDSLVVAEYEQLKRYTCTGSDWTFWWFKFRPESLFELPVNQSMEIPGALSDEVHANQCLSLLREDTTTASAYASALLSSLLNKWSWRLNDAASRLSPHREAVTRVIEMMHKRLGDRLSVASMAKVSCLGERRFRQVFEAETGLTPKRYYDQIRIEMGAEMLSTTPYSLAELADHLGYSSAFHFSKAFKVYFGKSPREYRGR